jgi:hypothetical protein
MLLYICLRLLASVNKLKVLDISFFKQLFSWVNAALRFISVIFDHLSKDTYSLAQLIDLNRKDWKRDVRCHIICT